MIHFAKQAWPSVRRLYLYTMSFIGVLLLVWGMSELFDTALVSITANNPVPLVLDALLRILAGAVLFPLHWKITQGQAAASEEERHSALRLAFFLLVFTVIGLKIFLFAFIDPGLLFSGQMTGFEFVGDAIVAMICVLLALYFLKELRDEKWDTPLHYLKNASIPGIAMIWLAYLFATTMAWLCSWQTPYSPLYWIPLCLSSIHYLVLKAAGKLIHHDWFEHGKKYSWQEFLRLLFLTSEGFFIVCFFLFFYPPLHAFFRFIFTGIVCKVNPYTCVSPGVLVFGQMNGWGFIGIVLLTVYTTWIAFRYVRDENWDMLFYNYKVPSNLGITGDWIYLLITVNLMSAITTERIYLAVVPMFFFYCIIYSFYTILKKTGLLDFNNGRVRSKEYSWREVFSMLFLTSRGFFMLYTYLLLTSFLVCLLINRETSNIAYIFLWLGFSNLKYAPALYRQQIKLQLSSKEPAVNGPVETNEIKN